MTALLSRSATSQSALAPRPAPRSRLGPVAPGTDQAVWNLHLELARQRDPAVRAALAREYDRYALSLAHRMHRNGEPLDDLEQVAREALLLAIDRFDPGRQVPFPAFATPTIMGAIRRHYRDHGWAVRVPRWVHEITVAARRVAQDLAADLGRPPTDGELADALGVSPARLRAAWAAVEARAVASLDAEQSNGQAVDHHERIGRTDPAFLRTENRMALRQALDELTEREREVVGLYFFDEWSQRDIADHYGVSQMQVSRWITSVVNRLRSRLSVAA